MTSIIEYWREIGITIGGILSFIAGRKSTKILEKHQQIDAIKAMQDTYNTFLQHYKEQYDLINKRQNSLQDQFNSLQLAYTKEVEVSQNWEKLHKELEKKYTELEKLYEKLKSDFESYKKQAGKK
jgi:archaellum component FlaC